MYLNPRAAVVGVFTAQQLVENRFIINGISLKTPMAAPCQIMIIESGDYTFKDYLKCGTPLALILAVITIFLMPMMFPFY